MSLARTPGLVRGLAAGVGEGLAARVGLAGSARSGPEEVAGPGEHGVLDPDAAMPAPEGLDGFARRVSAARSVPSPAAAVVELLHSTGALASWLTLHAAYRGEVPEVLAEGDALRQQILLMDIPAEARWRVEAADEHGLALRGTGPMGITLALWLRVAPTDGGSVVRLDAGLDGAPLRGPVGTTATRSVEAALASSLVALSEALSGAAPAGPRLRVGSAPVLHRASGRMLEASTPVIVGVGQVVQRDPDPVARPDRDPVALAVEALRLAAEDSGAALDLLAAADLVYAVPSASWTYADQAALVAAGVGATPVATVQSSPFGGDGGQLVVNDAAEAVAEGRAHVVLLAGAEAGATVSRAQALGIELDWPRQPEGTAPTRTVGVDRVANTEAETGVGLGAPVYVYALLESAVRRRLGRSAGEHLDHVARLWSRFSRRRRGQPLRVVAAPGRRGGPGHARTRQPRGQRAVHQAAVRQPAGRPGHGHGADQRRRRRGRRGAAGAVGLRARGRLGPRRVVRLRARRPVALARDRRDRRGRAGPRGRLDRGRRPGRPLRLLPLRGRDRGRRTGAAPRPPTGP